MGTRKTVRMLLALVLLCLFAMPAKAATRGEVLNRLEDFRQFFVDFQHAPDNAVPGDLLADCYGVIIMKQYKAGFVFGAKGGDGVILMHDRATGDWSAPAFVRMGEASFGFQIGGQAIDAIILIMNQAGVDMLLKTRFSIGVDASAAAGPVGRDVSAAVGPGTALLTYSRAKGLYAGASFEGGAMFNNDGYNEALYGMRVGLRDILLDRRVQTPREAFPMIQTLKSYAIRNTASATPIIPAPAPRPAPAYQDGYDNSAYRNNAYRDAPTRIENEYRAPAPARERTANGLDRRPTFGDTAGTADLFDSPYDNNPTVQARELPQVNVPDYNTGGRAQELEAEARRAAINAENAARAAREAAEAAERAAERAAEARTAW